MVEVTEVKVDTKWEDMTHGVVDMAKVTCNYSDE